MKLRHLVAVGAAWLGALAVPAAAQPTDGPTVSGPQSDAPAPPPPAPAALEHDARQRWAIRGCPVDQSCHGELLEGLREFELEAFPPPGRGASSPWLDDDLDGHRAVRHGLRGADRPRGTPGDRVGARRARSTDPTELRPDLPWLAGLRLPDVPVTWDHRIIKYLEFYRDDPRGRNIMAAWLRTQGRYRDLILAELRRAKLPEALLYISMIESSYDPHEYSRVGASGLWQFMPAGGRIYGLEQNRWIDERNDPVQSTRAAMSYFQDLHHRFGNWDLALAAYNAGYGAVLKGISKYNTNDFWQLLEYENALPWESSNYVPKFLAAAIVGVNRDAFGFGDLAVDPPVRFDHVTVPKSVALSVIARAAGARTEEIEALNPQLRRGRTPPGVTDYVVRIPRGTARLFAERFPQLRGDWDDADAYVVRHGERFEDIATTYGISRAKLRQLNGLDSETEVRGGMVLVVPKVAAAERSANREKAEEDLYASGVPRGDPGEPLMVPVPDPALRVAGKEQHFYRVVSGDTLYGIANRFGVDRHQLAAWNGLDAEAHLHPRMVLQVWTAPGVDLEARGVAVLDPRRIYLVESGSEEHLDEAERRIGRRRVRYAPEKPESFASIGKKYGLTEWDMARINQRPPSTVVEPGEEVLVYEVVDPSESDRAAEQAKSARRKR